MRELFCPLRFRFNIFVQWGWFKPIYTFPASIKGRANALSVSSSLFLTYFSSRTDRLSSSLFLRYFSSRTDRLSSSLFLRYFSSRTDRLSSSRILAAEQTNIQHEESAFNHGPLFLLETIPLSSIHSSWTKWTSKPQVECLIHALTFATVFFYLYDSRYRVIFLAINLTAIKSLNVRKGICRIRINFST